MGFFGFGKKKDKEKTVPTIAPEPKGPAPPPAPKNSEKAVVIAFVGDKLRKVVEKTQAVNEARISQLDAQRKMYENKQKEEFFNFKAAQTRGDAVKAKMHIQRVAGAKKQLNFCNAQISRINQLSMNLSQAMDAVTAMFIEEMNSTASSEIKKVIDPDKMESMMLKNDELINDVQNIQDMITDSVQDAASIAMQQVVSTMEEPGLDEYADLIAEMESAHGTKFPDLGIPKNAIVSDNIVPSTTIGEEEPVEEETNEDLDDLSAMLN